MSDAREHLRRAVGRFTPDPEEALPDVLRRTERRRTLRFTFAALTTIALSLALVGGLLMTFRGAAEVGPADPIPGPSLTSSPGFSTVAEPELRRDPGVITVDKGIVQGARWTLRAQGATVIWPDRDEQRILCVGLWIEGWDQEADSEDPENLGCGDPLPLTPEESGIYAALPSLGRPGDPPVTGIYGATPSNTASLLVETGEGETIDPRLYGPFPEIGDAKVYVVFVSPRDHPARFRAIDAEGRLLWQREGRAMPLATLGVSGTGEGVVEAGHGGPVITCPPRCFYDIGSPMRITFTARPDAGSTFQGWIGPCEGQATTCTVKVTEDVTVTALFVQEG